MTSRRTKKGAEPTLAIAPGLTLPLQAVTETFAILAKRRAGKSNAAVVMAEEMYDHGLPWVAIDPKGDWWGIRADGEGDAPGLAVTVFGGRHGDVPLEPTAGTLLADLVVDERLTCVLDVSEMEDPDKMRFLLDFARRLYRRNELPLHVFCEEADDYISQGASKDELDVVRAFTRLIKQGGTRGIGVTLVTQRSAMLHKNALSQAEGMIALRTTAPNDRKVIAEWVAGSVDRAEVASDLPSLGNGQAWVIAPHLVGEPVKVQFRRRRTFDSGATPVVGAEARTPTRLAAVDLDRIKTAMAETLERAAADDPKTLHATIARLEKDLAAARRTQATNGTAQAEQVITETVTETIKVPALNEEQQKALDTATERVREYAANASERAEMAAAQIKDMVGEIGDMLAGFRSEIAEITADNPAPAAPATRSTARPAARRTTPAAAAPAPASKAPARRTPAARTAEPSGDVSPARRRLLDALVSLESIGIEAAPRNQVALFAGVSPKSSGYANNLGAMNTAGLITYPSRGLVSITDEGRAHVDGVPEVATDEDLHERVRALLTPAKWRIIERLIEEYPESVTRTTLAEDIGVSAASSGYANNLGSLRSLGLLDYPTTGQVRASDMLFLT